MRKTLRPLLLFVVATALVWLPNLHRFEALDAETRTRVADDLTTKQVALWSNVGEGDASMRAVNPEWDFMSRTFAVLGLANRAVHADAAERDRLLAVIDAIVADTRRMEAARGQRHFMMGYVDRAPFKDAEATSIFVDGELLMMMSARDVIASKPEFRGEEEIRARRIERSMRRSPSMSGESYPDECWTFCNTTALAALAVFDAASSTRPWDHQALMADWVAHASQHLVDPKTGILVSSYTYDGRTLDGPEGSSIWMSAQNLLLVDPAFAKDQYARARRELGATFLGFGWAREWPRGTRSRPDVDSGPIVPLVGASAGSSGLALLGASAFGDAPFQDALFASLELAAFPDPHAPHGRYLASNAVGDAVLLYALSFGPLWERVRARTEGVATGSRT